MCDPAARETKNGSPPTLRKARTGELTPPGMNLLASANKEELVIPEAKRAASRGKFDRRGPWRASGGHRLPVTKATSGRCFPVKPLRSHLNHQVFDISSHGGPVTFRLEISCLVRSELRGARYKGRLQSQCVSCSEIVVVSRTQHHLPRLQAQEIADPEVGLGIWFIMPKEIGSKDDIPRQAGKLRQVHHEREIAVGQRSDDVTLT